MGDCSHRKVQTDFNVDKVNFETSVQDKFQTNFDQVNFQTSLQDKYQTKFVDKVQLQNANRDRFQTAFDHDGTKHPEYNS